MILFYAACQVEFLDSFALTNVNQNSESYGEIISTDDFKGTGTAWYFGHST